MVDCCDQMPDIRSQDIEFVGVNVSGNIGPGEQRNFTVSTALGSTDMDQLIEDSTGWNIAAEPLYQFTETRRRGRPLNPGSRFPGARQQLRGPPGCAFPCLP